jgi:prepilin-type N-terminal cleavage/methylation domain-containing protein
MNAKADGQQGFTIIEVVLVLAIAGLIFLMVFLALPALQRSQRDTQRKNDASRFAAAITQYESNNKGSLPTPTTTSTGSNMDSFITNYMTDNGDSWNDPKTGKPYTYTSTEPTSSGGNVPVGSFYYATGVKCGDNNLPTDDSGNTRSWAAVFGIEQGVQYCIGS